MTKDKRGSGSTYLLYGEEVAVLKAEMIDKPVAINKREDIHKCLPLDECNYYA